MKYFVLKFVISGNVGVTFINAYIWFFTALTVKILKIGTSKIITVIVLQMEQLNFTVQKCVQKMQAD